MANLRFEVVAEAFKKKPQEVIAPIERPSEYFGKNVFNRAKMYKYLRATFMRSSSTLSTMALVWTVQLPTLWLRASSSGPTRTV